MKPKVIIIGAGPAGLTAALELVRDGRMQPIVLEAGDDVGGLSRTVEYKGCRMDIGGHRFFSKSDWVMDWWREILPIAADQPEARIAYRGRDRTVGADDTAIPADGRALLVRKRLSRIYFLGRYFDYPITLNASTLGSLGPRRLARIGASYLLALAHPRRPERTLEDFLVNRFGAELYRTFFKDYTEKVWGVPCDQISAEWGAQRIKGLNLRKAAEHFFRRIIPGTPVDLAQKGTESSLIERFLYPKLGPGQMWEAVADQIRQLGGEIHQGWKVVELVTADKRITHVVAVNRAGEQRRVAADIVFSTMPIKELVRALAPTAPAPPVVREISEGLLYRDFFTVGLLVDHLEIYDVEDGRRVPVRDNWIYIQEPGVHVGRMQIFNNWSPWLVADRRLTWVGMEYFCNEGDALWSRSDADLLALAREEADRIGILKASAVQDQVLIRVPKTYPAYFGTYDRFDTLRAWLDGFDNLFLTGRNGMHRYNNQDHSMLTSMVAVDQIQQGKIDRAAIWAINTESEYHEEKKV